MNLVQDEEDSDDESEEGDEREILLVVREWRK